MNDFHLFAPFTKIAKQADGTIRAHSVIHDEALDDQGEIIDYDGGKAAIVDFMKYANVREMHGESAVGVVETVTHDDVARVSEGILHIVDPVAVQKVETGVYKGTSWGGLKGSQKALEKIGGHTATRLLAPTFIELSLVDRPSRPTAVLTLLKRADPVTEGDDMSKPAAAPAAGSVSREKTPAAVPDITVVAGGGGAGNGTPAAATEPLAKAATDDLFDSHILAEQVARSIEEEAGEATPNGTRIGILKEILAAAQKLDAIAADELGTPDDTEEAAAEEAEEDAEFKEMVAAGAPDTTIVLAAAAKTGDMRKVGARNSAQDQAALDQIVALAVGLGASLPAPADPAAAAAPPPPAEPVAKVATVTSDTIDSLIDRLAKSSTFVRADDLAAMKAELLGALGPIQEELAKVAANPASGGPLRYANDPRGLYGPGSAKPNDPSLEAVLAKVADPRLREQLGHALATEDIAAALR